MQTLGSEYAGDWKIANYLKFYLDGKKQAKIIKVKWFFFHNAWVSSPFDTLKFKNTILKYPWELNT